MVESVSIVVAAMPWLYTRIILEVAQEGKEDKELPFVPGCVCTGKVMHEKRECERCLRTVAVGEN